MAHDIHIPHIKRHTAGSSNELSFDVLDAARDRLDAQDKKKSSKTKTKTMAIPKGPSLAVPDNPLMPSAEVLYRKKQRRKATVRNRVLAVAAIAVGVGAFAWFAVKGYQVQEDFIAQYRHVVSDVAKQDAYLVEIDEMMDDPLAGTESGERARVRKEAVAVTASADQVLEDLERLEKIAPSDQDKAAIEQLAIGVRGRKAMVGLAMEAFNTVDKAQSARKSVESAWDAVVDADIAARDAVLQSNDASTPEALEAATGELEGARTEFNAASQQLKAVQPSLDDEILSDRIAYIEKRIEAIDYAAAVNEALLAGDRQTAAEINELYEKADRESAALARELPLSLGETVDASFADEVLVVQSRYDKERANVTAADSMVRKYLGIKIK